MTTVDASAANKAPSDFKKTADLVQAWYQSYYIWNQTVMANCAMNSQLNTHQTRVVNIPLSSSVTYTFQTRPQQQQQPTLANAQQQVSVYKVPSLARRFAAECFDAFYIQVIKIVMALLVVNYTDLM